MSETIIIDGIEYTKSNGRMRYNPEFHENHGKPFTKEDLVYLCSMYKSMKKADLSIALGRTVNTIQLKKHYLVKIGLFDCYKNLGKKE